MKKFLSLALALFLCFSLLLIFTGCKDRASYLKYGEKYTYESFFENEDEKNIERTSFVFNKDQTGTYDYYYSHEDYLFNGKYTRTSSCVISFKWRWADNEQCSICVFEVERTYRDEHSNKDATVSIPDYPLTIGDEFVFSVKGTRYILESSDVFHAEYDLELKEQEKSKN